MKAIAGILALLALSVGGWFRATGWMVVRTLSIVIAVTIVGLAVSGCGASVSGGDCNPNYSGCLDRNAYDYDCAGGSGDGPNYVDGPVTVLGEDEYGLDGDGDGIGCD
jgi:hypothetical protein